MYRIALAVAALAAALALAPTMPAQEAAYVDEVQGWAADGSTGPGAVSQVHNHQACNLAPFMNVTEPFQLQCTILGHNSRALVQWIRWSCESDVKQRRDINHRFTGAPVETIQAPVLTVDPSKCPNGWREIRITTNFAQNGERDFSTTRTCVDFRLASGGSNYCGGPTVRGRCGGGWWYTGINYVIAWVDCRDLNKAMSRPLVAGDVMRFKSQGGRLYVLLDPDIHAGDVGQVMVENGPGQTWTTVRIPDGLEPGEHKLHIRSQRNVTGEAGSYVIPFSVG